MSSNEFNCLNHLSSNKRSRARSTSTQKNQLVFFFFFNETNWCLGMMIKKLPLGLYEVMRQKTNWYLSLMIKKLPLGLYKVI